MFGITTDYEYTGKRERLDIWSGTFFNTWEADAYARVGGKSYSVTTYNGDKFKVTLPEGVTAPRTESNFKAIDKALSDAISLYLSA